jgi:hypothetical protein
VRLIATQFSSSNGVQIIEIKAEVRQTLQMIVGTTVNKQVRGRKGLFVSMYL